MSSETQPPGASAIEGGGSEGASVDLLGSATSGSETQPPPSVESGSETQPPPSVESENLLAPDHSSGVRTDTEPPPKKARVRPPAFQDVVLSNAGSYHTVYQGARHNTVLRVQNDVAPSTSGYGFTSDAEQQEMRNRMSRIIALRGNNKALNALLPSQVSAYSSSPGRFDGKYFQEVTRCAPLTIDAIASTADAPALVRAFLERVVSVGDNVSTVTLFDLTVGNLGIENGNTIKIVDVDLGAECTHRCVGPDTHQSYVLLLMEGGASQATTAFRKYQSLYAAMATFATLYDDAFKVADINVYQSWERMFETPDDPAELYARFNLLRSRLERPALLEWGSPIHSVLFVFLHVLSSLFRAFVSCHKPGAATR